MIGRKILDGPWQYQYKFIFYIFCIAMILSACNNSTNNEKAIADEEEIIYQHNSGFAQLSKEFQEFYKAFHSDSVFQMTHIDFPLQGMPDQADPDDMNENEFYYTSDQWMLHKLFDPKKFDISYIPFGEIIIEERIMEKQHQLIVIRRFARNSGGWRLIYYAGLNKYKARNNEQ